MARTTPREKLPQVRLYPADMPLLRRLQEHTGIVSNSQLVRAALRAYVRELGLVVPPADVDARPTSEG